MPIEPLELGGERYDGRARPRPGGARGLAHDRRRLRAAAALRGARRGPVHALPEAGRADGARWRRARSTGPAAREARSSTAPTCSDETLDLAAWARDAFALAVPAKVLCREDCGGLCPVCAADLNEAGPEHRHERPPDPRWAKLRELKLE